MVAITGRMIANFFQRSVSAPNVRASEFDHGDGAWRLLGRNPSDDGMLLQNFVLAAVYPVPFDINGFDDSTRHS